MATTTQISKVTKSLTTAANCRDDTKMLMQPYANWEEYLTPAPMSIAILAELAFLSGKEDFSIRKGGPESGFQHIKYPDSFRASLMQVCNSGWRAFNDAHKNMDQIRLYTNNIPNYIKAAVDILLQPDDAIVKAMLPGQLDSIREISDECLTLAELTEKRFTDVIDLIDELLETCTSSKQVYGDELKDVRNNLDELKRRKGAAENKKTDYEKRLESMKENLNKAQEDFKTSLNSMPSGNEIALMNLKEGLSNSVVNVLSGVTYAICAPVNLAKWALSPKTQNPVSTNKEKGPGSQSISQIAVDTARIRIEQSRIQLDNAKKEYEKCVENIEKNEKDMPEILFMMRNCDVKEVDFTTTLKFLIQGLKLMANVKDQWQKLVRFFQMVSNLMKTSMCKSLQDFTETGKKSNELNHTSNMVLRNMLYTQASHASNISNLVHMIAETYTEVSNKYLIDVVSKLSTVMTLDVNDSPEFNNERRLMANLCSDAAEGIRQLVKKNKAHFENNTKQRLEKIRSELMAVLPPESEAKERELEEIVDSASEMN